MTFEAHPNLSNEQSEYVPPVVQEVDSITLQGAELEAAFKAGAVLKEELTSKQRLELHNKLRGAELEAAFNDGDLLEEELTSKQRLELHNKGYQVTLPQGEVTLH